MRILHAIQSVDIKGGGPIAGLLQLAAADTLHRHEIVSLDAPDADFLANYPVPVAALGPTGLLGYSPRLTPWLRDHAAEFDTVVIHGLWRYLGFGAWRALHALKVPYFVQTHGMLDPWFNEQYPLKKFKKRLFWSWTEFRVLRDAQAAIFTCDEERQRSRRSFSPYQCTEEIIEFGIEEPPQHADLQRQQFLAAFPHLAGKPYFLFLSRIQEKKGCDLLLSAFAAQTAAHPEWQLVMAGPDQVGWVPKLQEQARALGIADRVTWAGMLTGDVKWGAYRSAEAFVLPSHQENFGFVVVEALACGTPVLISRNVQIWREVIGEGAGLADLDDLDGTSRLIAQWLSKPVEERRAMEGKARRCFEKRYRVAEFVAQWHRLLERRIAGRPSGTLPAAPVLETG